jgi:hypothetical protein
MTWQQIVLALCGLGLIGIGFGNFFGVKSRFVIYRHIVDETDGETLRRYQKAILGPYVLLGLGFIAFAVAVPSISDPHSGKIAAVAGVAVFLAAFVWIAVCNKKYLGRFSGPNFRRLFRR